MGGIFQNINLTDGKMLATYSIATDPDAQAFIDATGITGTNASAINTLVVALKGASIWTKFKAVYPFVGSTATSQKFNLKNPADTNAAFRLSFVGGGTHSANGYLPNGINAYANTFLNANSSANTSNHLSYYSKTNLSSGGFDIGFLTTALSAYRGLILASSSTRGFPNVLNANSPTTTTADSLGFYAVSRTANNSWKVFKNNSAIITSATGNSGSTAFPLYIGALPTYNTIGLISVTQYSNKECAFASIGDGLSDAEVLSFYTAVQNYQTTLGRQV